MIIIPLILYAETHYSFTGIYSRFKKNEPEIIIDLPHRLDPATMLPILLLVKDSNRFPVYIKHMHIVITQDDRTIYEETITVDREFRGEKYIDELFYIDLNDQIKGKLSIDVSIEIINRSMTYRYHNDNYRISSHAPFQTYRSDTPLPQSAGWVWGDLHYHTSYTEDHVEFGAPLFPSLVLFRAMGLSFFAATDHSYDLDDCEGNFLKNDSHLKKWHNFLEEANSINANQYDFVIMPGEEVSVGNGKDRNVHMILLNNRVFVPGKGDSAEVWLRNKPDTSIHEVLSEISDDAIAIAAHPEIPAPFLEWLLIRRGKWEADDYSHDRLAGLQVWNGISDLHLRNGIHQWVQLLLNDRKLFIYAGNDAHGNFNRFRQIGFPFWTMRESYDQIAGKVRTGVKINGDLTTSTLNESLRNGRCIITNGPFVEFSLTNEHGEQAEIGGTIAGGKFTLQVHAKSSEEFGQLDHLKIFIGDIDNKRELLLKNIQIDSGQYIFSANLSVDNVPSKAYIRIMLSSIQHDREFFCWTNPIWIRHS